MRRSITDEVSIPPLRKTTRWLVPFLLICAVATAQAQNIRGKVSDENGMPIPGVNILVKGSTLGTTTDVDGQYALAADGDQVLVFSFIGYVSQEVSVANRSVIDITLQTDTQMLNEVVVVGYGTQKKSDITGAVASLPQERLEMVPNLNIAQALQGAVAGVMMQTSSAGAAPTESLMIRGRNSIKASNSPLIVVDGIPYGGALRDINPNDVKSIEVLKDASSAAIYGSRGSNGVILVTTKAGIEGAPKISYNGYYSVQRFASLPHVMNGEEFYNFKNTREPGVITASELEVYESGEWVDWLDLALRNGASTQHNVSISGGSEIHSIIFPGG